MTNDESTPERRRGDGHIKTVKRKGGVVKYRACWDAESPDGTRCAKSKTFPSEAMANAYLRTVSGKKYNDADRSPSLMTVSDLVREYIDRAESRIAERTVLTYRQRQRTMIDPLIGKQMLGALSPLVIQRWIDKLGRLDFKPSTIHSAVAVMMGALREASMLELTDRHLGAGVRRPTIRRTERATWTEEQVRRVLNVVRNDDLFGALYHVALATGMRPGELRALKWADVDLTAGVIRVRRTITRDSSGTEVIEQRTKTSAGRAVAISAATVERLRWHRAKQRERHLAHEDWHDLKLVFDRGDGHWLYQSHWLRAHVRFCAEAAVPQIRMHDIRHSFATLMLARNVHPKIVSDILGHSQIGITLDLYSHVSSGLQLDAIEDLSRLLFDDDPSGDAPTAANR